MGELFANIWGSEKSWYQSLTSWGLILFVGVTSLVDEICAQGILSAGICETASSIIANVGLVLTTLGIRKAATSTNS